MSNTIAPQQEYCDTVEEYFGKAPDASSMSENLDVIQEVVAQEVNGTTIDHDDTLSQSPEDVAVEIRIGRQSEKVKQDLGCTACELSGECKVVELLDKNIEQGTSIEAISKLATMLASAPSWLRTVRAKKTGLDISTPEGETKVTDTLRSLLPARTDDLTAEETIPKESYDKAKEKLHGFIDGIENKELPSEKIESMPELSVLKLLKANGEIKIPGTCITFERPEGIKPEDADTRSFDIYDAQGLVNFKGQAMPKEEYAMIITKMFDRISELGANGLASTHGQIAQPDSKMQSSIHKPKKDGLVPKLYEIRMNGKNRLYFTFEVTTNQSEDPSDPKQKIGTNSARIVILGSHGGDDDTQHEFLAHIGI